MPITPTNPFKGRQYPGEVILLCVRWYLRFPLAYQHVSEILAERGIEVDASCIWRWVQAYAPELNKRCRPHLKPTNKSYRIAVQSPCCPGMIPLSRADDDSNTGRNQNGHIPDFPEAFVELAKHRSIQ
jgi:hypothetical protein